MAALEDSDVVRHLRTSRESIASGSQQVAAGVTHHAEDVGRCHLLVIPLLTKLMGSQGSCDVLHYCYDVLLHLEA